ncbi:uncharacterized protein UHOD_11224 [Ustilago sp. UG-2017b]|nr:uncharacterized protein UHOD_11224 [Ustilago sp. UG-2017b]
MASTDPGTSTGDPLVATRELLHPVEMQPPPSPATQPPVALPVTSPRLSWTPVPPRVSRCLARSGGVGQPNIHPNSRFCSVLEAPHLPTLTPTSALPFDPLPAPNNPGESSVHCLFPWIPTETVNAVYKDLLSVMGLDAQEIGTSEVEITNHARICSKHDRMTDSAEISGKDGCTANFTCKGDQALPRRGPSSEACSWSPLRGHKMKTRRTIAGWRKKSCVKDTGE